MVMEKRGPKQREGVDRDSKGRIIYYATKEPRTATCKRCSAQFVQSSRQRQQRFCSKACRVEAYTPVCVCGRKMSPSAVQCATCSRHKRAQSNSTLRSFLCAWCGHAATRSVRNTHDAGVCCSRACGFKYLGHKRSANKSARLARQADQRKIARLTRIQERAVRLADKAAARVAYRQTLCETCQRLITPNPMGRRRRFCSRVCMKASPSWRETTRKVRRNMKQVRRARQAGVGSEYVRVMDVFERDGWRCQLCGCATPKRLRGQMVDQAPELDHIVPLAVGGTHSWDNVQCACRKCNAAKGANPLGQPMLRLYASV